MNSLMAPVGGRGSAPGWGRGLTAGRGTQVQATTSSASVKHQEAPVPGPGPARAGGKKGSNLSRRRLEPDWNRTALSGAVAWSRRRLEALAGAVA
jgi:hypothetical protein